MQKSPSQAHQFSQEDDVIAANREQLQQLFPLPTFTRRQKNAAIIKRNAKKAIPILSVALMAIATLAWVDPAYRTEHIATAIGERKTLTLADNSQLSLNTNTQLQVSWHLLSRRVNLQSGQALFTVTHNQYRPFYVTAGATQVKVVGTVFDVKREGEQVTVTVLKGRVQVRGHNPSGAQYLYLTPNEQAISNDGEMTPALKVDSATKTAWKDGKIIFERTPLIEALAEIQRYQKAPVILNDNRLAKLQVSGVFNSAATNDILNLLPHILPVSITHSPNGSINVSAK